MRSIDLKAVLLSSILVCLLVQDIHLVEGTRILVRQEQEPLEWWQETIIYQVYPRSHKDTNGDGVGDLLGIEQTLDHLVELGINAVWLSPIYKSPMKDFGYDVSDYRDIEPMFGTMDDFVSLSTAMREKNIKLIMDFVPNHTSDEHEWFQKSVAGELPYKDYYVWRNESGRNEDGPIPPNNWVSLFGGSMWEWREERQQFYLHQFAKEQPDLNFENNAVLKELLDVMEFWVDKGVDGFRVDAVPHMFENQTFENEVENPSRPPESTPDQYSFWMHQHTYDLPNVLDALAEMRQLVDNRTQTEGKPLLMLVESTVGLRDGLFKYYGTPERPIAHFPINFEVMYGIPAPVQGTDIVRLLDDWYERLPAGATSNWLAENHDNQRVARKFGQYMVDPMNMLMLLLPGSTITYYGGEIGMNDTYITWEQTVDPSGCNAGPELYEQFSRDPCRTPLQWNNSKHAGFSDGDDTWLPVNPNYLELNVASQRAASESHFKVYQKISELRKTAAWKYGPLEYRLSNGNRVFGFSRILENGEGFLVLMNLGDALVTVNAQDYQGVPANAIVATRNFGFTPSTTLIGTNVTTANVVIGARSSLILQFPAATESTTLPPGGSTTTTGSTTTASAAKFSSYLFIVVFVMIELFRITSN